MAGFYETITAAIADFAAHGYDREERLAFWVAAIHDAAVASMVPEAELAEQLRKVLGAAFDRLVGRATILQRHPGVGRFTIEWIKPKLRAELDRRKMAAANLIRLNRDQTIADTLRRFQGWATSVPPGGARGLARGEVRNNVRSELATLKFRERRVISDQGHKLNASISAILADEAGAIAARWRSGFLEKNYAFREDHRDRDSRYRGDDWVYLIRGSWAHKQRFVKPGDAGFLDEITQPGEEVFCRCYALYLYSLDRMPDALLTERGRDAKAGAQQQRLGHFA